MGYLFYFIFIPPGYYLFWHPWIALLDGTRPLFYPRKISKTVSAIHIMGMNVGKFYMRRDSKLLN